MIKGILLLAAIGLVLAGCGGHSTKTTTQESSSTHRIAQVAWYIRGQVDILEKTERWPPLVKLSCREAKNEHVACFLQLADNSCGMGIFFVDAKRKKIEGIWHRRKQPCTAIVSPPA